jgi:hypothetical protein
MGRRGRGKRKAWAIPGSGSTPIPRGREARALGRRRGAGSLRTGGWRHSSARSGRTSSHPPVARFARERFSGSLRGNRRRGHRNAPHLGRRPRPPAPLPFLALGSLCPREPRRPPPGTGVASTPARGPAIPPIQAHRREQDPEGRNEWEYRPIGINVKSSLLDDITENSCLTRFLRTPDSFVRADPDVQQAAAKVSLPHFPKTLDQCDAPIGRRSQMQCKRRRR